MHNQVSSICFTSDDTFLITGPRTCEDDRVRGRERDRDRDRERKQTTHRQHTDNTQTNNRQQTTDNRQQTTNDPRVRPEIMSMSPRYIDGDALLMLHPCMRTHTGGDDAVVNVWAVDSNLVNPPANS